MRDFLHGDGAVLPAVQDAGRLRRGGILGSGHHPPRGDRKVRPALAIHTAGNQHSDASDNFLHLVRNVGMLQLRNDGKRRTFLQKLLTQEGHSLAGNDLKVVRQIVILVPSAPREGNICWGQTFQLYFKVFLS